MVPICLFKDNNTIINRKVTITFNGNPTFINVVPTFYKYDKDFAFSYCLDDGNIDAYQVVVPLFNGGTIIYLDGNTPNYSGLTYTDGAGNEKPFNATFNINMSDIEPFVTPTSKMNNTMLQDSYVKGIDLTNHSYSNKITNDVNNTFSADPEIAAQEVYFQIDENYRVLKLNTGIKFFNFTSPSNDSFYDSFTINYLNEGKLRIVNNINNPTGSYAHGGTKTAEDWINNFGVGIRRDFVTWSDENVARDATDFDFIDTKLASVGTNHAWFSLATHRVNHMESTNPPSSTLRYQTFRHLMEGIERKYGTSGSDNMWFASINSVYEYLKCVRGVKINQIIINNKVELTFDFTDVSPEFRNHSLSMIVDSDVEITDIEYDGFNEMSSKINYKSMGNTHALINIGYKPTYENALTSRLEATISVYNLEISKSQIDLDIAQSLVDALRNGEFKDSLQNRIDLVLVIPDALVMQIDFGRGISGYILPFPWNTFSDIGVGVGVGSKIINLATTTSSVTNINIEVIDAFNSYDSNFPSNTTELPFPYEACRDVFKVAANTTAKLRLSNLDENKLYDFLFYAYRGFVGNVTQYTIKGVTVNHPHKTALYTTSEILNISPDSGGILDITVKGDGSNIGYLGVMQITQKSV